MVIKAYVKLGILLPVASKKKEDVSTIEDNEKEVVIEEIPEHESLHHILLYGGAGQGKTTLAKIIKNELSLRYGHDIEFIKLSPSQLSSTKQLDEVMLRVAENPYCVLFIDEIHGMKRVIEESLYAALQDFEYDITLTNEIQIDEKVRFVFQEDRGVQTIKLPKFTCIAATTLIGDINKPLRDRFPIQIEMEDYKKEEIIEAFDSDFEPTTFDEYIGQDKAKQLIKYHLDALGSDYEVKFTEEAKSKIAEISFSVMRVAHQYKRNTAVIAKARNKKVADIEDVKEMMRLYGINEDGLGRPHIAIIKALIKRWRYTPEGKSHALGSQALADIANVTKSDIDTIYVPILTKLGILERDARSMKQLTPYAIEKYKNIF